MLAGCLTVRHAQGKERHASHCRQSGSSFGEARCHERDALRPQVRQSPSGTRGRKALPAGRGGRPHASTRASARFYRRIAREGVGPGCLCGFTCGYAAKAVGVTELRGGARAGRPDRRARRARECLPRATTSVSLCGSGAQDDPHARSLAPVAAFGVCLAPKALKRAAGRGPRA